MKVFLDDERIAPDGWTQCRTPAEAIALLRTGVVEEISLDHDLGLLAGEREETGYDVLPWIEKQVVRGGFVAPQMKVHSANPVARRRMLQAIDAVKRLQDHE